MAKASAQITISRIVDISSVTRYYLLRSSTLAAPSKPTANPPGGSWTTTEPAYTSGSTNTLYFVDLTVFTNSTFSYSAVSKSSSYEAAKAAYNKALDAAKTATNYMKFENNVGLIVGDMTANTLGKNVLIDADSVDIRDGSTVAASFSATTIDLGSASSSSVINLCDIGTIRAAELNAGYGYNLMKMSAPNVKLDAEDRASMSTNMATMSCIDGTDSTMGDYGNANMVAINLDDMASFGAIASDNNMPEATINATTTGATSQISVKPREITIDSASTKINIGSQYVQFETDGSYPGIATANYIRTPTSGIIPKTSGGSGSVGTSGWPFNNGYFKNLNVAGTGVSNTALTVGGIVDLQSSIKMKNGFQIKMAESSGTLRDVMYLGTSNNLIIGNGVSGNTNIYSGGGSVQLFTSADKVLLRTGTGSNYTGHFIPGTNAKVSLGMASYRWHSVYAANATIQTSDAREKENITPLGASPIATYGLRNTGEQIDIHSELFDRLQPVQYNFIDGNGRICYGLVAQDVISAMDELGISEDELDLVHHEKWTDEETGEEKDAYGLAYANLIALLIHEVQKLKAEVAALKGGG